MLPLEQSTKGTVSRAALHAHDPPPTIQRRERSIRGHYCMLLVVRIRAAPWTLVEQDRLQYTYPQ